MFNIVRVIVVYKDLIQFQFQIILLKSLQINHKSEYRNAIVEKSGWLIHLD